MPPYPYTPLSEPNILPEILPPARKLFILYMTLFRGVGAGTGSEMTTGNATSMTTGTIENATGQ